jgi:DMSO/TMAO reductase YedYZ molybdopterin-dependent catalytic subunit
MNPIQPETRTLTDEEAAHEMRRMTRRSFTVGGIAAAAGLVGWGAIVTREPEDGIAWPLRRVLQLNERLARATFSPAKLAPEFARERANMPRVNGRIGLGGNFDLANWRLKVMGPAGVPTRSLLIDDVRDLPRVEMTTEFNCVEGWSDVVHWAGARLADFAEFYQLLAVPNGDHSQLPRYVGLSTPDDAYSVGLDIESALHPQTLLCYEMDGQALEPDHGAPLRLVTTLKYGVKCIKRIGSIRFSVDRPADYWAKKGYDYYLGL